MSRVVDKELLCPGCGAAIHASAYESINVSIEPALRERVLSRQINASICPECGVRVDIATNLLYHDATKKFMVWLRLNEQLESGTGDAPALKIVGQRAFPFYRLRIVNGWPELCERVHVLESGLDEGLIEALKVVLWPQIPGNTPENFTGSGLYFVGLDSESGQRLRFAFASRPEPEIFSYPKSEYDKMVLSREHKRVAPPNGEWTYVNHRYVMDRWL